MRHRIARRRRCRTVRAPAARRTPPMILIYGSRLYGKTDEVKGLFHVATKFGHLWYLPLFPLGSHLVFERTENGWRGVPLSLQWKSVLLAWARTGMVVFTLVWSVRTFVTHQYLEAGLPAALG